MTERTSSGEFREQFRMLLLQWREETYLLSNAGKVVEHPAYREIIRMGEQALPLIFADVKKNHNYWFVALKEITGQDMGVGAKTYLQTVYQWLDWGVQQGYINEEGKEYGQMHYDIDGMHFTVQADFIEGSGWQGRRLDFLVGEEDFIAQVIQKVPEGFPKRVVSSKIWLSPNDDSSQICFNVKMSRSWVEVTDLVKLRQLAFSQDDRERVYHVLEQLKSLREQSGLLAEHFCEEWGVVDDD